MRKIRRGLGIHVTVMLMDSWPSGKKHGSVFQPRSENEVAPSTPFWQWDMKGWAGVGRDNVKKDWAAKKSSYHMAKSTILILRESERAGYNFQKNFLLQVDFKTGSQMEASIYCLCSVWPSESPLLWIKMKTAALYSSSALCPARRSAFGLKTKEQILREETGSCWDLFQHVSLT